MEAAKEELADEAFKLELVTSSPSRVPTQSHFRVMEVGAN